MWRLTWRDLVFRRRRFLIAAAATALVFAVTLLLSGVVTAVHNQNRRIVESFDATEWWVREGSSGPFSAGPALGPDAVPAVGGAEGVTRADGVLLVRTATSDGDTVTDVNLIGVAVGGLGSPMPDEGRPLSAVGEAVVDVELGYDVDDAIVVGGHPFTVVGIAKDLSYLFGIPTIILTLPDAQLVGAASQPAISAVVSQGPTTDVPPGLARVGNDEVIDDLERPLARGLDSIELVRTILTITALGIVGLIIYLSSLERARDVAVLKATGATGAFVGSGLAVQGLATTLLAAVGAVILANLMAPSFPMALELTPRVYAQLFVLAVIVGVLASLVGVRRALRTDPALAFG